MSNKINAFDFDIRKCTPNNYRVSDNPLAHIIENKEVMLKGLQYFCMSCRLCGLGCELIEGKELDPHVFSNMQADAKYIVVGQNPGLNECIRGIPFIGDSGKNFDDELEHNGLDRRTFYITNICKCFTKENKNPSIYYRNMCSHILKLEIKIISPTLIITLGGSSFNWFCPDKVYSESLGKISESEYGKIYAVYHPSPLNLNHSDKKVEFGKQINLLVKLIKRLEGM